ncbi:MAG: ATP-dependent DNA helicase [Castellaniella sp.]
MTDELAEIFAGDGPLARASGNYQFRPAQLALAQAVHGALQERRVLVAEAGTGTGKTWAYLVPALLARGKVLISTGTRTLQDQLYHRDLPRVREALAVGGSAALLKGRANYVCHYHLQALLEGKGEPLSATEARQLRRIEVFARQSTTGDRAELATVPEDAPIWRRVTSTRENCLGAECPYIRDCFLYQARRRAQEADVVVINHALFMADLSLRDEGITDLLPEADMVVFDEAHQLSGVATQFLGTAVSTQQLIELSDLVVAHGRAHAPGVQDWDALGEALSAGARGLRLACAALEEMPGRRAVAHGLPSPGDFAQALDALCASLDTIGKSLGMVAESHPDLAATAGQTDTLAGRLTAWRQPEAKPEAGDAVQDDDGEENVWVRWVEWLRTGVRLHSAPLWVASRFRRSRRDGQAWVLTSATLSVNGDFSAFQRQLGLEDAETATWPSPFDYANQALLYVPRSLPQPSDFGFARAFVDVLLPLVRAASGGVLVLCTTLRAVSRLAELLEAEGLDRPVLRQGQRARAALLDEFREQGRAVLVGSASFWEGVDVPGEALTVLAIDKLPFAPPDDPVLQARLQACRRRGGNPFMEYQLPEAAIALKQGAGRLIRSESDRGILLVGDVRLVDKPYGRLLWRGLPPFRRTREPHEALEFLGHSPAQLSQSDTPDTDGTV